MLVSITLSGECVTAVFNSVTGISDINVKLCHVSISTTLCFLINHEVNMNLTSFT